MAEPQDVRVERADDRYVITVDGQEAGFTRFRPDAEGRLVFPHTVVDPAFSGRGLATTLVADAMADVAARGETVVPRCPFVVKYLQTHDVTNLRIDWPDA